MKSNPIFSLEEQLFKAIHTRSLHKIKKLVSEGVNINITDDNGATALYRAVITKQHDVVQFLLSNDANPNIIPQSGDSPLSYALGLINPKIAKLLIENGADIKSKFLTGELPLHKAVKNGHVAITQQILDKGANIELLSDEGRTPLDIATTNMHPRMIELLINYGANITDQNLADINTQPINNEDVTISSFVICAKISDAAYGEQKDALYNTYILGNLYHKLDSLHKNMLCERLLYKAFWSKELSAEGLVTTISQLLEKINYLSNIIGEELPISKDILDYKENVSNISLQNELGNIPSLLRTIVNSFRKKNLWNDELTTKICSDVISKAEAFESMDELFKKFNVTLISGDLPSIEEVFLASRSANYISLIGQSEILHYVDFTERMYEILL